jgi:hypothetical protein
MAIVCGLLVVAAWPQAASAAPARPAERISVTSAGAQGDGISGWPSVSADGRNGGTNPLALRPDGGETAFPSDATNLVPADTNAATDIFVRDTGCS